MAVSRSPFGDAPRLTGSPSPRARTVNAKRWVQSAQAVSRFGGESKSPRADGQCKVMDSERPGSAPFGRGVQACAATEGSVEASLRADGQCKVLARFLDHRFCREQKRKAQIMDYRKVGFWQLVMLALLLNFVAQTIHEAGHWTIYETLGREPVWGFSSLVQIWGNPPPLHPNEWIAMIAPDGEKGWLRLGSSPSKTEWIIMLAAGPLASLLGVVFGLSLMRWNRNPATKQMGLVLALIGSLIMSQYYLRGSGGDEYFLAVYLGIPKYIIDIPFGLAFIIAFILGVWTLGDWRTRFKWLGAILLGSVPAGLFLMKANDLVQAQVNQGNPLFQPLLGWSLPVVVVNVIVFLALWIWWKRANKMYYSSIKTAG